MKYVDEYTNKMYDNANDCIAAEKEYVAMKQKKQQEQEQKAAERKARAAEVEEARKAMNTAQHKYHEVLEAFIKDYGSYHLSLKGEDAENFIVPTLFDFFNRIF